MTANQLLSRGRAGSATLVLLRAWFRLRQTSLSYGTGTVADALRKA